MEICVYYEKINDESICIRRVYASSPIVEIPEVIDDILFVKLEIIVFHQKKSIYLKPF